MPIIADGYINKSFYFRKFGRHKHTIDFITFVEKSENSLFQLSLESNLVVFLTWPEYIESDLYKYEFDHQNSVCFKREIDKYVTYVKLYSFTIAAWKLYYILDCLQINSKLTRLRKGFQYFEENQSLRKSL
ncbi:17099_t:CDS:2 [Gigaspora margarita]|uniref:17099_t:CDS:1 n=1 Tax=Gigaspora margarita TaxID=4874 RepID=A0ABN7UWU3_GIGMA|nr:17099_t:CDS:2 [Gigaspora margarita]